MIKVVLYKFIRIISEFLKTTLFDSRIASSKSEWDQLLTKENEDALKSVIPEVVTDFTFDEIENSNNEKEELKKTTAKSS